MRPISGPLGSRREDRPQRDHRQSLAAAAELIEALCGGLLEDPARRGEGLELVRAPPHGHVAVLSEAERSVFLTSRSGDEFHGILLMNIKPRLKGHFI
jgi:hypothetical protein